MAQVIQTQTAKTYILLSLFAIIDTSSSRPSTARRDKKVGLHKDVGYYELI